jgi:hypothetical protein
MKGSELKCHEMNAGAFVFYAKPNLKRPCGENALSEPLFRPGGTTRRVVLSKLRYVPARLADQNNSLSSKSKI